MKLICLKDNLKLGVNVAEKMVGKNISLPILSNFLLNAEDGFLKITATDLEIGINVWINGKIDKKGSVTVPAKLFSNLINNLPEDKITLETKDKNLKISSKSYNFQLVGADPKEFPILPKIEKETAIEIEADLLQKSLSQVMSAASLSEARPELAGAFFNIDKSAIKIAATDSFRLAEKTINKEFKANGRPPHTFIIPLRAVNEVIRILEGKDKVNIKVSKNQIFFEVERINLISRLIEGDYPNYTQIIPKGHKTRVILNKEKLINAIKLASFFSSKVNDVKLNVNDDSEELEASSSDSERGQSTINIKAKIQGEPSSLSFNHHYLLDGLNNIIDEEVVIEFNGDSSPTVLRSVSNDTYIYLIMPIKNI
jgi:DNA polymerase-3 subunit beta